MRPSARAHLAITYRLQCKRALRDSQRFAAALGEKLVLERRRQKGAVPARGAEAVAGPGANADARAGAAGDAAAAGAERPAASKKKRKKHKKTSGSEPHVRVEIGATGGQRPGATGG